MTDIEQGEGVLVDRVWQAHEAGNILRVADLGLGTFPVPDSNSVPYGGLESQEASLSFFTKDLHDVDPAVIHLPDAATEE